MTRDEFYKDLYEKAKNTFPPEQKRQNEIRIYLSGPITGVPDFKEKFEAAKADIEDKAWGWGYDLKIVNPAAIELPAGASHEDYMQVCMRELAKCNSIYMLNGWQNSRGACREYGYALGARMMILHQPKPEEEKTFAERVMDKLKKVYEEDSK